ncbi:16393_t:CDS:2, partial [Dentiscutata erythropus]
MFNRLNKKLVTTKFQFKVLCYCKRCNGKLVDTRTRKAHELIEKQDQDLITELMKNKSNAQDGDITIDNYQDKNLVFTIKPSNKPNLNSKNINDSWILICIFKYQERFWFSDTTTEFFIKIFKLVLTDVDRKQFNNFLFMAYMAKKLLEIKKNNKNNKTFTICPKCNKLYYVDTNNSGFECTHVEFPNHLMQTQHQPCRFEVLNKNWQLDDLISAQSSNLKLLKGLSLIRPKAAVGSLAAYNNLEFNELRYFRQIYQLEIEDTITDIEPFPSKMLSPKKANFGLPDNVYNVLMAYYNNAYDMKFLSIREATQIK